MRLLPPIRYFKAVFEPLSYAEINSGLVQIYCLIAPFRKTRDFGDKTQISKPSIFFLVKLFGKLSKF